MVDKAKYIWLDGKFIPWAEAQVHIMTHSLHYGLGVFEGIRAYHCQDGRTAIFRLKEHIRRLFDSAHVMQMEIPFNRSLIEEVCCDLLRRNGQESAYLRPLVFVGEGVMGLHPQDNPIRVTIISWVWGAYLGEEGLEKGIRVKISSFSRHHVNVMMTKAKTTANYVNSILAKREATSLGFDEALLLDIDGYVAEASGENIFIVSDGVLRTPPLTSVLSGITRASIFTLAQDLGLKVKEELFSRDELYLADEAFLTGTAAELTPIREVDGRVIGTGKPGLITLKLQAAFFDVVQGQDPRYGDWLTYIVDAYASRNCKLGDATFKKLFPEVGKLINRMNGMGATNFKFDFGMSKGTKKRLVHVAKYNAPKDWPGDELKLTPKGKLPDALKKPGNHQIGSLAFGKLFSELAVMLNRLKGLGYGSFRLNWSYADAQKPAKRIEAITKYNAPSSWLK